MIKSILCLLALAAFLRSGAQSPRDTVPQSVDTGSSFDNAPFRAQREAIRAETREALRARTEALREMSVERIRQEVQRAEREATRAEVLAQVDASRNLEREVARAQAQALRAETEAAREMALSAGQVQRQVREVQREVIREAQRAAHHDMLEQMARDHLIERGKEVRIELRDGHLYIDGKEQPPAVYDKYKSYFHSDRETIQATLEEGVAI